MEKKRLFVDMDGVLAVFNNQISSTEELYAEGYFRNLKPQENVVNAIRELIKEDKFDIYILSSYLADSKYALKEKNAWLDEYLPEMRQNMRIFVPCGTEKGDYVKDLCPEDFLLDDYTHNLLLWQPPATGIKLLNDINHTQGTWQHNRISFSRSAESLAQAMREVIIDGKTITDPSARVSNQTLDERMKEIKEGLKERKKHKKENRDIKTPGE